MVVCASGMTESRIGRTVAGEQSSISALPTGSRSRSISRGAAPTLEINHWSWVRDGSSECAVRLRSDRAAGPATSTRGGCWSSWGFDREAALPPIKLLRNQ